MDGSLFGEKLSVNRSGQISFLARDYSGKQKMGGQNQSLSPIEAQLQTLLFVLYYLKRTCCFHFQYVSIKRFCNEAFVVWLFRQSMSDRFFLLRLRFINDMLLSWLCWCSTCCCHVFVGTRSTWIVCYLNMMDKLQKRPCRTVESFTLCFSWKIWLIVEM